MGIGGRLQYFYVFDFQMSLGKGKERLSLRHRGF